MAENRSECRVVSALTYEASRLIRDLVPHRDGDNVKSRIAKAARRLEWSFSRAKDVWFADGRISVRAVEMDRLRALKAEAEAKARKYADQMEATRLENLAARIERSNPGAGRELARPFRIAARAYRTGFEEVGGD